MTKVNAQGPVSHSPDAPTAGAAATSSPELLPQHAKLIEASGITPQVARARGYRSATTKQELAKLGFGPTQQIVPTLVIPVWGVTREIVTYQHRPDEPRVKEGKPLKYETPRGSRMVLDVPPLTHQWLGDPSRPLFITEGARKADAAVSRDLCCIALLGVWNWRGTNEHGGKVALADWESVALKGRQVYIVFDSDVTLKPEVREALVRLKAFLERREASVAVISLPAGDGGVKVGLDDYLAQRTVADLLALASPALSATATERHALTGHDAQMARYRVENRHICREKTTRDGTIIEPLCNFDVRVVEEVVSDDGVDPTLAFVIEGQLDTGEPLPPASVLASRFVSMNWVTENWGLRAIVRAGQATRDYLREAIQRLSPAVRRRHIYTHTGWRNIGGEWGYLTAAGAVGADGVEVDLRHELTRYQLPHEAEDPVGAMRDSLQLFEIAPLHVTVPLWAATYRAPLASAFPADFSLWLEGVTGSLKSTLAALFLCHYGEFDRQHLPGAWSSTANQLERRAFILKDIPFVIDDYVPQGGQGREMEFTAQRILRAQGNLAGRGRLRSDLTDRPAFPPRGLIISTGEQHPTGQSLLARILAIEVWRPEVNIHALTAAQQRAHRLPHAMTGYLRWLVPQMANLPAILRETFEGTRKCATMGDDHRRVPETVAQLWLGLYTGLTYAEEIGACSPAGADELRTKGWGALLALGRSQAGLVEEERPARRFLRVLVGLLVQGRAVLLDREAETEPPQSPECLGWMDEQALYLLPEPSFRAVTRFCQDAGAPFPIRQERLCRDLDQDGVSDSDKDRHTKTVKISGRTRRVIKIWRTKAEQLTGEEFPLPGVTTGHRSHRFSDGE